MAIDARPDEHAEQIDEALRGIAASSAPELPLPGFARSLLAWLVAVPAGTPALLPPFFVEIR